MLNICYESTKKCNLNCDYCITSDNPNMIKNDNYEKIIDFISKLNPERLVISGGEPLLDTLLEEKLVLISNKMKNTYVSISTNGAIENYDFNKIIDYVDCLDFSIPSLDKDIYKNMRGKDRVDVVKNNISNLKQLLESTGKKIDIRISYTLTKVNKDSLEDLLEYAKNNKVNSFRVGRFFPFRNAGKVAEKYELSENEINSIIESLSLNTDMYEKQGLKIIKPINDLSLMEKGYVTINFKGDVFYPSKDGRKSLGNINNEELIPEKLFPITEKQQSIFKNIDIKPNINYAYSDFLSYKRIRESSFGIEHKRSIQDEFNSDKTRIIYSSSFRRLQQKAQVFSLEKNSNVHSRLTHSLEVADVGRILATKITEKLVCINGAYKLESEDVAKIISVVENICLMHDLGNPPFGHFGEDAIKTWWKENKEKYIKQHNKKAKEIKSKSIDMNNAQAIALQKDFELFDGNPQGFRIVSRLYCYNDYENQQLESGLNLTYSTLINSLKYVGCSDDLNPKNLNKSISKKPGYFVSEKPIVDKILKELNLYDEHRGYRAPLTYIMEAADDIAYCMSDIADGFEKGVISIPQFAKEFKRIWEETYREKIPKVVLDNDKMEALLDDRVKDFNTVITANWADLIVNDVVNSYVNDISSYIEGTAPEIINNKNTELSCKILDTIRNIANGHIYRSPEAEGIEVAGFSIVTGLLNFFGELLKIPKEQFEVFVNNSDDKKSIMKKYAYEFRIFNMLSKRCVESYRHQLKEWESNIPAGIDIETIEWWLRIHLVIDHISGMTDDYALQAYQLSKGIDIKIR